MGKFVCSLILLIGVQFHARGVEIDLALRGETGIVSVIWHTLRFGEETAGNDLFNYREQGGQEVLFPFFRATAEILVADRHEVEFLFQPLTFETRTRIPVNESITIDGVEFAGPGTGADGDGTPLDLVYGFDFWRGTYRYRAIDSGRGSLSFGAGLQLRNARISFETADGEQRVISQDLGPVPVLSASGRRTLGNSEAFVEGSVEGFYAPIRYLNLRDVDVIGWLYDAAVRVGVPTGQGSEAFLGIRALGGGADGTGREPSVWTVTQTQPRYTWNNLNLVALTLGARLR